MNNNISTIVNALDYYDKNCEKYNHMLKKIKYIRFIPSVSEMEYSFIILFDKNKNEVFRSRYEVIGLYNKSSKIWSWAWCIPRFKKNTTTIIRQLWNYGANLDHELEFLKMEITTSRFRIADITQLDIHVAFASYLAKQPFVYKYYLYANNMKNELIDNNTKYGYYIVDNDDNNDDYVIYYLFLLDLKNIEAVFESETESEDTE